MTSLMAAIEKGKKVIAQINNKMPRTLGDGIVHFNNFDACVLGR